MQRGQLSRKERAARFLISFTVELKGKDGGVYGFRLNRAGHYIPFYLNSGRSCAPCIAPARASGMRVKSATSE